jgi:predicted glycosyltransferase involved in capsule biosynthesis
MEESDWMKEERIKRDELNKRMEVLEARDLHRLQMQEDNLRLQAEMVETFKEAWKAEIKVLERIANLLEAR